jgi:16S rRNA (adenine1518-N6/adenine1519-N6)-dimethyltransferase
MLKKSLSQHLIKDKNITEKMVKVTNIDRSDTVIEVGAGHGDLTRAICRKAGHVYAIELDRTCAEYLEPLEREYANLTVIFGDILKTQLARFKGQKNLKIVGNIPYQITAPILFKILEERSIIESAYLTMQKEIALRIVSKSSLKTYGSLSAVCQLFSHVKVLFYMKPGLFVPPPKVESAFLSMEIKDEERGADDGLMEFIKACFQNKRKHLRYALSKQIGPEEVERLYYAMGFPPSIRAEEIPPEGFKKMYQVVKNGER